MSEREGTRVRACVRLDVRVMGRVCVRVYVCVCMQTLNFWSLEILQIVTNDHIYIHACVHICKGVYTWVCTRLQF